MTRSDAGSAEGTAATEESPRTAAAAFSVCARAPYHAVKAMLAGCDRTTTAGLLLTATARQCEGDALRAEAALRQAADAASGDDLPYVIDVLAPLLISRGLFTRAAVLLDTSTSATLETGRIALHAVIAAASGEAKRSRAHAARARALLLRVDNDVVRMRVHQRLALAAYYRHEPAQALEETAEGLRFARLLGARRFACLLHAVAFATCYTRMGDLEAAWRRAVVLDREASASGDWSCRTFARAAAYELAAERGDESALDETRRAFEREPLPELFRERFAARIAGVLRLGWSGEFSAASEVLTEVGGAPGRSIGERALCRSLRALTALATGDRNEARRLAGRAIATPVRTGVRASPREGRYRRLARALAVVASDLAGDGERGGRAAGARALRGDVTMRALTGSYGEGDLGRVPATVRGYARLLAVVRRRTAPRPPSGPLTAAEVEILRLVAKGRNAPQIAALLGRSPHTIRTHLRNAGVKLEAHGRAEMLARARQLGALRSTS